MQGFLESNINKRNSQKIQWNKQVLNGVGYFPPSLYSYNYLINLIIPIQTNRSKTMPTTTDILRHLPTHNYGQYTGTKIGNFLTWAIREK